MIRLEQCSHPFFALALLLAVPGHLTAQAEAIDFAVPAYQQAATEAFLRNDAVAIDSLLADDFTLTDSRGVVSGREDAVAAARAREATYTEFRNVDQRVRLYLDGQVAVVTGRTLIEGRTADGTRFSQDLPFTDTLVRIGGRWRMVASHVSRPPGPDWD
ncbi:MAG TPA: nuclear transport factor 2 family protein [Gemmatimonadales bacterium]|nr:nuclear transport factor 2 family protein [Gemmatimonadales bacterium]